jgi:chitodextrinase
MKQGTKDNTPDMTIESIAGSNSVTLNWPTISDDDNVYDVYRDDELISRVQGNQFTDDNVTPSTKYRYSVIGTKKFRLFGICGGTADHVNE